MKSRALPNPKTFTIPLDDFKKLPQDTFLYIPIINNISIGRSHRDLFYNKTAQTVVVTMRDGMYGVKASLKSIPADRMIGDFYFWDNRLAKFRNGDEYQNFLKELKSVGINKLVGTDFSIWSTMPRPLSLYNQYLNMNRYWMNYNAGMKSIFNMNVVKPVYDPLFNYVLPSNIPTVMFDQTHPLTREQLEEEKVNTRAFLKKYKTKSAIIQVTGSTIGENGFYLLPIFKDLGITYGCIPSNTTLMSKVKAVQARKNAPPKEPKIGKSKKVVA